MQFDLLGPVVVRAGDLIVPLRSRRERLLIDVTRFQDGVSAAAATTAPAQRSSALADALRLRRGGRLLEALPLAQRCLDLRRAAGAR